MVGVKLLSGPRSGRFPYSNCLLVESVNASILVDSGCGVDLLARIRGRLTHVVYTHHHPDHISGHHALGHVKAYSPEGEEAYRSLEDLGRRYATTYYMEWIRMARDLIGVREVPHDNYYKPGEDLCIRDVCLKTISAPGHLLTHTLVEPDYGWLHLTDIDLTGFGPWYANPESDPIQFLMDMEVAYNMDARTYTTSHKGEVLDRVNAHKLIYSYVGRFVETVRMVHKALEGKVLDEWRLTGKGIIYRRYLPGVEDIMRYFEASMIRKLVSILYMGGCVRRLREGYTAAECDVDEMAESILSRFKPV